MDKAKLALGLALVALVTAAGAYFYPQTVQILPEVLGASGTRFPNGLSTDSTSPSAGQIRTTTFTTTGAATFTGSLAVGSSGTAITKLNAGTCYLAPYAATIAATSTAIVDCQATAGWDAANISALTGVTDGDSVNVTLSTSTAGSTVAGLHLIGASASTTAGYIQLRLSNLTGTTYTWPTSGTASGTASYIVTDQ